MNPLHGKAWREHLAALAPIEAFYLALAFLPGQDSQPELLVDSVLEHVSLDAEMRRHLREHHPGRLVVYRRLMRNNLSRVVQLAIPRASARLEDNFKILFDSFLDNWAPTSRFLRHVTAGFLDFWEKHPSQEQPYLHELARLEAARVEVASALATTENHGVEISLDVGLAFAESVRLLDFEHAVHLLPDDEEDRTTPKRTPTYILAYRDENSHVRYLNLSALSFHVLKSLRQGKPLGESVTQGANAAAQMVDESCLSVISDLLGSLADRGVICGTIPVATSPGGGV